MIQKYKIKIILSISLIAGFVLLPWSTTSAYPEPVKPVILASEIRTTADDAKYSCGDPKRQVKTSIDIGCVGKGNPIADAAFAIIRFLSLGVGLVIVASLTFAGIQYTMSRGDPKATAEAISRIRSNIIAFLLFLFAFAILNYLIPAGFIGL